jgi:hypothetical protein
VRTTLRRSALALITAGCLLAAPAAAAEATEIGSTEGLYGAQDPTYDGAFRQSLALIAQVAAGEQPDPAAVDWLLDQQCPDGGFMGLRIDAGCTPDPDLFTAEDSNSTALAAIALAAVGEPAAATAARDWLAGAQTASGGFEFQPGFGADPNSSGLAILALRATGADPTAFNGRDAVAGLLALQADCTADPLDIGGFIAPFSGQADLLATVQATPAAAGATLPVPPPATFTATVPDISCPGAFADPALAAADWLESQPLSAFAAVDQRAFAVMSFAAVGAGADRAAELLAAMSADLATAVYDADGELRPGAAALYVLAALALGEDPDFGDANLLDALADSIRSTAGEPVPTPTTSPGPEAESAGPHAVLADSGATRSGAVALGLLLLLSGSALVGTARWGAHR